MLLLSTPAAQQLSGDQVGRLVGLASTSMSYLTQEQLDGIRQLLQLPGAGAVKPRHLRTLLTYLTRGSSDPEEEVQEVLEDVRKLLLWIDLGVGTARQEPVESMQVKCDQQHGFCLNVQREDEDDCHVCLLLESMARPAVAARGAATAAAAALSQHGQGNIVADPWSQYASVSDLPVARAKVALLKQAVHHYWFGKLLCALPVDGEGSRQALAPQLQGIIFEAFREILRADDATLGTEEREAALKHLLKQKESGLLSKEQVRHLLELARLAGLGHAVYVLLVEGLTAARELQQYWNGQGF